MAAVRKMFAKILKTIGRIRNASEVSTLFHRSGRVQFLNAETMRDKII